MSKYAEEMSIENKKLEALNNEIKELETLKNMKQDRLSREKYLASLRDELGLKANVAKRGRPRKIVVAPAVAPVAASAESGTKYVMPHDVMAHLQRFGYTRSWKVRSSMVYAITRECLFVLYQHYASKGNPVWSIKQTYHPSLNKLPVEFVLGTSDLRIACREAHKRVKKYCKKHGLAVGEEQLEKGVVFCDVRHQTAVIPNSHAYGNA